MGSQAVGAVLTHGSMGQTPEEQFVERARLAVLSAHVKSLRAAGVDLVAVATDSAPFLQTRLTQRPDHWIATSHTGFDFGEMLKGAVSSLSLSACIYVGSGAGPLLRYDDYRLLVANAKNPSGEVLLNNLYSTDFASIAQAQRLLGLRLPRIDNALGILLTDQGVSCRSLPRNLRTQYDIDTPTDVLLLQAISWQPEELRSVSDSGFDLAAIEAVLETLTERSGRLWLYGRINPTTWSWFQDRTACQTAGVVEGRGLRSYRDAAATICQTCGSAFAEGGWEQFFDSLAKQASAAVLDTRPLLAIGTDTATTADRFRSDLLRASRIGDHRWMAFTRAARDASLPVLLGGHNLVSGGLYLLGRACWKRRNLERRLCGRMTLENKE